MRLRPASLTLLLLAVGCSDAAPAHTDESCFDGIDGTTVHEAALIAQVDAVAEVEVEDLSRQGGCEGASSRVRVVDWAIGGDGSDEIDVFEPGGIRDLASIDSDRALLLLDDSGPEADVRWHVEYALGITEDRTLDVEVSSPFGGPLSQLIRDATGGSNALQDFVDWLGQEPDGT